MVQLTNIDTFIQEFNKLEEYLRRSMDYSKQYPIARIINDGAATNPIIKQYKDDLHSFRELRNSLVHQQGLYGEPFADPYPATVKRLKSIFAQIANPPTADSICIKDVAKASPTDSLKDILTTMRNNGYTVMPVVDDDVVIGVISEYTILKWVTAVSEFGDATLLANNVEDLKPYFDQPAENDPNAAYRFIDGTTSAVEVTDIFNNAFDEAARLNAIFVTKDGIPGERLLGIITTWDILNSNKKNLK